MDGNLAMDKNAFESENENQIKQQYLDLGARKGYRIIHDDMNCNVIFYFEGAYFWVQYHSDVDEFIVYDLAGDDCTPPGIKTEYDIKLMKKQLEIDTINNALYESEKERTELIERLDNIKKQLQEQIDECYNTNVKSVCKSIIEDNF